MNWIGPRIDRQLQALVFALVAALLLLVAAAVAAPVVPVSIGDTPGPQLLTVRAGTLVVWQHTGSEPRQLRIAPAELRGAGPRQQQRLAQARLLQAGERWSYRFATPGTYRIILAPAEGDAWESTVTVTR